MKHYVTIEVQSENAANSLKKQIEEQFPLIEGNVKITKDSERKPLNEVIEELKIKGHQLL